MWFYKHGFKYSFNSNLIFRFQFDLTLFYSFSHWNHSLYFHYGKIYTRKNIYQDVQKVILYFETKNFFLDFPGGLVVNTPCFSCRRHRFNSWSGKFLLLFGMVKKKKKSKKPREFTFFKKMPLTSSFLIKI